MHLLPVRYVQTRRQGTLHRYPADTRTGLAFGREGFPSASGGELCAKPLRHECGRRSSAARFLASTSSSSGISNVVFVRSAVLPQILLVKSCSVRRRLGVATGSAVRTSVGERELFQLPGEKTQLKFVDGSH